MLRLAASFDSLPDVLQVTTIGTGLVGAVIGTFVQSLTTRQFLENIAIGGAIGALVGGVLGFGIWGGAQLDGG